MYKWKTRESSSLLTFVRDQLKGLFTTKDMRWCIENNRCAVNGNIERFASKRLEMGSQILCDPMQRPLFALCPEAILYEDEWILIYNKPPYIASEKGLDHILKMHLVHRLDKETSGVIIYAKNVEAQQVFEELFRQRKIQKHYLALVKGSPREPKGLIEVHLASRRIREGGVHIFVAPQGQWSKTAWKLRWSQKGYSLLELMPHTGRTHQLRVHLNHIGLPIVGDREYGGAKMDPLFPFARTLLHAERIAFEHPFLKKNLSISAPCPSEILEMP